MTSSGPSVGRVALWQVGMLLVWGGIFHSKWHSSWLPALIGAFLLLEALAVWDFRRTRRKWLAGSSRDSSTT